MLHSEIITTEGELATIADDWRQLYARARLSPVNDLDRLLAWWNMIGKANPARRLHVTTLRNKEKLVGVLPLNVLNRKGLRILQSDMGMGAECDVLCTEPALAALLWQATRKSPHYDFAKIKGVYPGTWCEEALDPFAHRRDAMDFFHLHNRWPTGQDWLDSLSGNTRGNFRRCTRRLEEKGALKYAVWETGPVPADIIARLVKEKVDWAKMHHRPGLFREPGVHAYFQRYAETAAAQGSLFLAWLGCGHDVITYNLGLIDQGVLHIPFWAYDPAWAAYSPGNVIMMRSIMWAIDQGLRGVNFMYTTGIESEKYFKRKYANDIRQGHEFTFSGSAKGWLAENAFVAMRAIKRLIPETKEPTRDAGEA